MPATARQTLGDLGERLVTKLACPKCKNERSLKRLPRNFKCADIICDFCGYLAQVKATTTNSIDTPPTRLLGAAWEPQNLRMQAGIYFPLFFVLVSENRRKRSIWYLPADLQTPAIFKKRNPLSSDARRAGWTGYLIDLSVEGAHPPVRLQ